MALRASNGPTQSTRSAKVGDRVEFTAKIENTALGEDIVALYVEETKEPFPFLLEPPTFAVAPKSRKALSWAWVAALPEGKPALTFRGKLVLRRATDGSLVATAPFDLYVSS